MKTSEELRRENLAALRKKHGGNAELAKIIGRSESQLSQYIRGLKNSTNGQPREVGADFARHVEECVGLERGWMDNDHSAGDAGHAKTEDEQTILKGYRLSDTPIKQFLLDQARTIIKNHRDKHTHPEATESDVQLNVMAQ